MSGGPAGVNESRVISAPFRRLVDPSARGSLDLHVVRPWESADDEALVEGCLEGDEEAWAALAGRHGSFVRATVVRLLDAPDAEDPDPLLERVWGSLRRPDGPLRRWSGGCQLRSFLGLFARQVARQGAASDPGTALAAATTPNGLYLDDLGISGPLLRVEGILGKLPPNVASLVRMRVRGLSRGDMAATLGRSPATVLANLERIASRLASEDDPELSSRCYRVLLDAADIPERVDLALRSEQDPDVARVRSAVDVTWRAVGERALGRSAPRGDGCLEDHAMAGFVDGTLRGAGRARAEGHVATCARCIDEAAALVLDLRVQSCLRDAAGLDDRVAVAAACVATLRFGAAARLIERARQRGADGALVAALERLAQAGQLLDGGHATRGRGSQVVATRVPSHEEAPLVAFEALVRGDPRGAVRAIDDRMALQGLGARLRLLAAATSDLEQAREMAETWLDSPRIDPSRTLDARAVLALPPGRALPREILAERLRDVLPEAVRFIVSRARS